MKHPRPNTQRMLEEELLGNNLKKEKSDPNLVPVTEVIKELRTNFQIEMQLVHLLVWNEYLYEKGKIDEVFKIDKVPADKNLWYQPVCINISNDNKKKKKKRKQDCTCKKVKKLEEL
jgi:hypothetical protein